MTVRLEAVHPVLGAADVEASLEFFERLGFQVLFRDRPDSPKYAAVRRDDVTLHLQWNADAVPSPETDRPTYRFLCLAVDELFAEFLASGAATERRSTMSPFARPADSSWGTREFHLRDPGGNGLQFYRPLRESKR